MVTQSPNQRDEETFNLHFGRRKADFCEKGSLWNKQKRDFDQDHLVAPQGLHYLMGPIKGQGDILF